MPRPYTDEELQGAIDKLMRTSIERVHGILGNRRTDVVFSQVQDAAAGVFITTPNAPYYVVALAVNVVLEQTSSALKGLVDLDDTVRATDRRVQPIKTISALANAKSALGALTNASSTRITSLTRIEDVPAYQRFEQSTQRFLRDQGKAVRSGGNIVQTPAGARDRIAGLVQDALTAYQEIIRRVQLIAGAIADYDALNLPATLSAYVISNSRDVLDQRYQELEALNEKQRLEVMRDVVLDVLATRATVKGFGALNATQLFLYFEGNGTAYADVLHPAEPARLVADLYGPYVVLDDTALDLTVDGVTSISVDVPESYVASLEGYIVEDYNVTGGVNDLLTVRTTTVTDVDVTLTAGAARTAQDIADDINTTLGGLHPVEAQPYGVQPLVLSDPVVLSGALGSLVGVSRLAGDFNDLPRPPQNGDWLYLEDSVSPDNDGWYVVGSTGGLPVSFVAVKESAPNPVNSPGGSALMDLNSGPRSLRLTFKDASRVPSVVDGWSIAVPTGDDAVKNATVQTLGFIAGGEVSSQRTTAQSIVDFINDNPAVAPAGTARLSASQEFGDVYYTGVARSEPTDPQKVVVYKLRESLAVTSTGGNGALFSGLVGGGVVVGDVVALRGTTLNDIQNYGTLTVVNPTSFEALMDAPVTAEALVDVEVGPNLSAMLLPAVLRLSDATGLGLNDGEYDVLGTGGLDETGPEFELTLSRPLVAPTQAGSQPVELGGALVGAYSLVLSSTSTLTDTQMAVEASSAAGPTFWAALPASIVGETEWFSLPEAPTGVEEGDSLEFRDTNAQAVTSTRTVVASEEAPNVLQLTPTVPTDLPTYALSQSAPTPSARLKKHRKDTYNELQRRLSAWLTSPLTDTRRYFGDLRRLINPLVVNENPTAVSVSEASAKVQQLFTHITDLTGYLQGYQAPLVEPVDRLLDAYREQGADRARDVLLEASFSQFFNLTQDESSYSGNLQRAIRAVNQNDLPINKNNRNPGGQVIESYEELDYEYDTSDTENGDENIELTGESYEFPGSAF